MGKIIKYGILLLVKFVLRGKNVFHFLTCKGYMSITYDDLFSSENLSHTELYCHDNIC